MSSPAHTARNRGPWLVTPAPLASPRLRLFCVPYAGGIAQVYAPWARALPPGVELCAVQLPGRGARFSEPLLTHVDQVLGGLVPALAPWLTEPFAFFGHSLGAIIAFELTRRLERAGGPRPVHLFVSGRRAPHIERDQRARHTLPHDEFVAELRAMGGTPEEVLREPELLELMLPIVRADFAVVDGWRYRPGEPLDAPVTAFAGADDQEAPSAQVEAWREHTRGGFAAHTLPGGHFFVQSERERLLPLIAEALERSSPAAPFP